MREQLKDLTKQYDKSENDLKALQSVGQIVGEVLKQLTEEKCKYLCSFVSCTSKTINLQLLLKQQMGLDMLLAVEGSWIKPNLKQEHV